jgi:hypothetical protein
MIAPAVIKEIMKLIATACGIQFMRAEQNADRPALPFISYKVLTQEGEPIHTESVLMAPKEGDDTTIVRSSKRDDVAVVSISFLGNGYGDLWQFADRALDYVESPEGKEAAAAVGIYPKILSPQVEDRTVFLETGWEYRVGFDLALVGLKMITSEIAAIDMESSVTDLQSKM